MKRINIYIVSIVDYIFFFSSRRRHTRFDCDWSSDVCSSDLTHAGRSEQLNTERGPISMAMQRMMKRLVTTFRVSASIVLLVLAAGCTAVQRSEERRVGKECRSRWSPYH